MAAKTLAFSPTNAFPDEMIAFIGGVSMANGHRGLREIAAGVKPRSIDVETLKPGQYVGFVNKAGTAAKLFAANNVLIHYRSEHGKLTSEGGTGFIPEFMGSGGLHYKKRVEEALFTYVEEAKDREAKSRGK